MVYDIKPEKIDVLGYLVYLVNENYYDKSYSQFEYNYIITEMKINGTTIPKKEYDESLENEHYDELWFYSNEERVGINIEFDGQVFLKEFKVEIPYCQKCSLEEIYDMTFNMEYGTTYKFEIINNGVDLPMEQFSNYNYQEKDGKIIFSGIYNIHSKNYNDKEYIKSHKNASENIEDRIRDWENENVNKKLYPSEFIFYP